MKTLESGNIVCCDQLVKWKDCPEHDVECYYFCCAICGYKSTRDCEDFVENIVENIPNI